MIYKNLIEENIYRKLASNTIILFGSEFLDEDVKLTNKSGFKISIRTKEDGGRSGKQIGHGVAVKAYLNNEYIDLFVVRQENNTFKCEIDRHKNKNEQNAISRNNNYKIAEKFIERNGELLSKIYETKEGSIEFNEYINQIKALNPEFKYSK